MNLLFVNISLLSTLREDSKLTEHTPLRIKRCLTRGKNRLSGKVQEEVQALLLELWRPETSREPHQVIGLFLSLATQQPEEGGSIDWGLVEVVPETGSEVVDD